MSNPIHPNSTQAKRLHRAQHREARLGRRKALQLQLKKGQHNKMLWFRDNIDQSKRCYSHAELLELIEKYLHRMDDEIATLHVKNKRTNRSKGVREDLLAAKVVAENEAFDNGIPDLTRKVNMSFLKDWDGRVETMMNTVELRTFRRPKKSASKESTEMDSSGTGGGGESEASAAPEDVDGSSSAALSG